MLNGFRSLSSPQRMQMFYRAVAVTAAAVVGWAVFVGVLSLVSWWGVMLVTIGLAVAVYVRGGKGRQREEWIDAGCCAACGYDLTRLPTSVCPECGRDASLDEPTWRRLRREHEAKYGRDTAALTRGVELDEAAVRQLLAKAKASEFDR
jgi:hypothetical protein